MLRPNYPSELADKAMVRFPDGMKPILVERAKANVRSLSGEIVSILAQALGFQGVTAAGSGPEKADPAAVPNGPDCNPAHRINGK